MKKEILLKFAKAWSDQNIDEIATFFTDDCIYKASVGPEPGVTYVNKENVMKGIKHMIDHDSGGESFVDNLKVFNDFGVWEWVYVFKDKPAIVGCDLFEFKKNHIKMINAFRKTSV